MPTYFGLNDDGAQTNDIESIVFEYCRVLYTCPGSGNQNIQELSALCYQANHSVNILLGVYDTSGNLVAEGTIEIAVQPNGGVPAWQGHMTQASVKAAGGSSPGVLVGGNQYYLAYTTDYAGHGLFLRWKNSIDVDVRYTIEDDTGGMPSSFPSYAFITGVEDCLRCGVEAAEEYDGTMTVTAGLVAGSNSIYAVSENTDQVLSQNLIAKAGSLLSPSFVLDQVLSQNLIAKAGSLLSPSFVLDQVLTQNLQTGTQTILSASNITDQILSQNLLSSITSVLSALTSTDQVLTVNVIPGTGSPYDVTVEITAGAISATVNLGLLLGIYSVLSASVQTDQILGQSIISKSGSVLGTSEQTDQILTQNLQSALATLHQLLVEIIKIVVVQGGASFAFPKEFLDIDRYDGLTKDIVISFREGDFDQNIKDRNDSSSSVA